MKTLDPKIRERVNAWLNGDYDDDTKANIRSMLENDKETLIDSFYTNLEFGTGGMRGIMGPGTNRMNIYTVGMATQGLSNYLISKFPGVSISVAIAYDCRNNSELFAATAADVFTANGIKVYLFDGMRPTPELSFAIRKLKCQSGLVITASHNPKEYNGYKVYWDDGAQLVPPHDKNVIAEVLKITDIKAVNFKGNKKLVKVIGADVDKAFLKKAHEYGRTKSPHNRSSLKIVFTPLHGTGGVLVPKALYECGFTNLHLVDEQMKKDGNFSTVRSPNPEEASALVLALKKAREVDADLVLATDPDADRVGIAVKNSSGNYMLLNGNQTGALVVNYVLSKWKESKGFKGNEYIVKTIVTSELIREIALSYGVECYDVLTGFKWIADIVRKEERKKKFIVGLEESYGYMIGDFVRDKDAITTSVIIAELAAEAFSEGKTVYDKLIDIYLEHGLYIEDLVNIYKPGISGMEEIKKMMEKFRHNPPKFIGCGKVVMIMDYLSLKSENLVLKKSEKLELPKSDVLQFITTDGSKISMRPSGTEPKIKFYMSVRAPLPTRDDYEKVEAMLRSKIERQKEALKI